MRTVTAIACCLGLITAARAQHTGLVSIDALGFSFEIPAGWQGGELDGTWGLVSAEAGGTVMITTHEHRSLEALERDMNKVDGQDPANRITRTGGPTHPLPNAVAMEFGGTMEWQPVQLCGIGLISDAGGPGLSIVAIAPGMHMDSTLHAAAFAVMRSVRFRKPVVPPVVVQWWAHLNGTRLTAVDPQGPTARPEDGRGEGTGDRRALDLCAEGWYRLLGTSDTDRGGPDGSTAGAPTTEENGSWEVRAIGSTGAELVLHTNDGRVRTYALEERDGGTYLNGERWFRTTVDDGEHAPQCAR